MEEKENKTEVTEEVKTEVTNEKVKKPKKKVGLIVTISVIGVAALALGGYLLAPKVLNFGKKTTVQLDDSNKSGSNTVTATSSNATGANATSGNATAGNATSGNATASNATDVSTITSKYVDKNKAIVYRDEEQSTDKMNVPKVNIDSDGATSINNKIKNLTNGIKQDSSKNTSDFYIVLNSNILSIIYHYNTGNDEIFQSYNINVENGVELTNSDLMAYKNMTADQVKANMVEAVTKVATTMPDYYNKAVSGTDVSVKDSIIYRINEKSIDAFPMFLNGFGEIVTIAEDYDETGNAGNNLFINVEKKVFEF